MRTYLSKYIIIQWTDPKSSQNSAQTKTTSRANPHSHTSSPLNSLRKRAKYNNLCSASPKHTQS